MWIEVEIIILAEISWTLHVGSKRVGLIGVESRMVATGVWESRKKGNRDRMIEVVQWVLHYS
jgi:hypothetical protein